MTRRNLKLNRGTASNGICIESQISLDNSKKHTLPVRAWRLPVMLFSASIILMQFCAVSVTAQLSIVVMEKNRRRIALPTTEVTRIPGATRQRAQPITVIPMSLEVGDVLVGDTGLVAVRVRCNSAEASITGKFRVRMLPSVPPDCNLYFEGSPGTRLNTTASGPTNVVSGAFTLGTRRTRYEIEFPKVSKRGNFLGSLMSRAATPTAKVFEGEATVIAPGFSGAVKQGEKFDASGFAGKVIRKIAPEDYEQAAEILAQLDVSQAERGEMVELSVIFLGLAGKQETEVRARAVQLMSQARAGADFCTLAATASERPPGIQERCKMGPFQMSALPPVIATAISHMSAGEVSEPVRTNDGYQILRVDARTPAGALNDQELDAAYHILRALHRDVLEKPGDLSSVRALKATQQSLKIPANDPPVQQPPSASEVTLKPNEKRIVSFPSVNNVCGKIITVRLTLNNVSFVRLVSAADMVVSPGVRAEWQLEFDATGLKPGAYAGEIELTCADCANKECLFGRQRLQVTLNVL